MSEAQEQELREKLYDCITKIYFPNDSKLKKAAYYITQYWINTYNLERRRITLETNAESIKKQLEEDIAAHNYEDARQIVWRLISFGSLIEQQEDFEEQKAQGIY